MKNFIIGVMIAITAYYLCKLLDKLFIYLAKMIREKWNTYFLKQIYLFFVIFTLLSAFWINLLIMNSRIYTIVIYV